MKHFPLILLLAGAALSVGADDLRAASRNRAVLPAIRRLKALEQAEAVLAPRQPTWRETTRDLPDPFFRDAAEKPAPAAAPEKPERSDAELLRILAQDIHPTGTMVIGEEQFLLLGGKRLKVGDQITITLEGAVYHVRLTSIERNSYTLRLNDHELRCEFK